LGLAVLVVQMQQVEQVQIVYFFLLHQTVAVAAVVVMGRRLVVRQQAEVLVAEVATLQVRLPRLPALVQLGKETMAALCLTAVITPLLRLAVAALVR
jgi:hypothetical protein